MSMDLKELQTTLIFAIETINAATYAGFARENPDTFGAIVAAMIHHDALDSLATAIKDSAIILANAGLE